MHGKHLFLQLVKMKVKVTLRLTVSQSVNLGVEPHLRLMTRYLLLSWQLRSCFLWGALSDERTGLSFIGAAGPCQRRSVMGPSPLVLATIFYRLRFETFHFVASYDSQGHGGGIWPRLHKGFLAVTLQLDDITVGANRTENAIPSGIHIMTRVTVATRWWCLLCCNLVTAISLDPLFRLSSVRRPSISKPLRRLLRCSSLPYSPFVAPPFPLFTGGFDRRVPGWEVVGSWQRCWSHAPVFGPVYIIFRFGITSTNG
jgi:hypothetical protein